MTHYKDGTFSLVETGTEGDLWDIYGTPDGHVYTGGWDYLKGIGNFLHIYQDQVDRIDKPELIYNNAKENATALAVYTTNDTLYACCGNGIYVQSVRDTSHWRVIEWNTIAEHFGQIKAMRGAGDNNIFAAGYFGTIMHYNGKSWKMLTEFDKTNNTVFFAASVTKNHVYIAGGDGNTYKAVIYVGTLH